MENPLIDSIDRIYIYSLKNIHFQIVSIVSACIERENFPTYHKLTHHTIKSTKYDQLQNTKY